MERFRTLKKKLQHGRWMHVCVVSFLAMQIGIICIALYMSVGWSGLSQQLNAIIPRFFHTSVSHPARHEKQREVFYKLNLAVHADLFNKNSSPAVFQFPIETGTTESSSKSSSHTYKFYNFHTNTKQMFHLKSDKSTYFVKISRIWCFKYGTDLGTSRSMCDCKPGWYGEDCGIPDAVYLAYKPFNVSSIKRRHVPRRIIHAVTVNHEFDLMEARMHELYNVVDVFLFLEANYTNYGQPKKLHFLEKFRKGFLRKFQEKIVYIFQDHFPKGGFEDGWITDAYVRGFLCKEGLKKLKGVKPDDLYIDNDADEILRKEILLFLKLYDGYSEPIGFAKRWLYYGFFWQHEEMAERYSACSIAVLRYIYDYDAIRIKRNDYNEDLSKVVMFEELGGGKLNSWLVGLPSFPAGWHCSWCFHPEGIRTKLVSAINADFPRWGDFPEKRNLSYIKTLIAEGSWFDGSKHFSTMASNKDDPFYAPHYMMQNSVKFNYLLQNPHYKNL